VLVWAGMRGAITLAAAQTLPMDTPHRSLLVLIAFIAATASLMIQGLSLKWVIARYAPQRSQEVLSKQASSLAQRLRSAAEAVTVESLAAEAKATQAKATPVQSAQPETAQPEASDSEVDPTAGPVVSEPGVPAPGVSPERLRVERVNVQYRELRRARDEGIYDSDVLRQALAKLDAEQLYRQVKQEN
jgi:NhaP-type Na+/H+ or K+/H+ antiporter